MPYKDKTKQKAYNKEYHKEWYLRNKEKVKEKALASNVSYKERNRKYVQEYKLERGCSKCGYKDHYAALDFHHLDSGNKEQTIARMCNSALGLSTIQKEIDKCIILCANCHRIEHI